MKFLARISDYQIKHTKDLAKTCKVILMTEDVIAGQLDGIAPDANVIVTIEVERPMVATQ